MKIELCDYHGFSAAIRSRKIVDELEVFSVSSGKENTHNRNQKIIIFDNLVLDITIVAGEDIFNIIHPDYNIDKSITLFYKLLGEYFGSHIDKLTQFLDEFATKEYKRGWNAAMADIKKLIFTER